MSVVLYDAFICHASEDKPLACRFADVLISLGYSVWMDLIVLLPGDSLREKIDEGLAHSMTGIVILTPHFFSKRWARMELDGLASRQGAEGHVILPVLAGVTADDVRKQSPVLAGLVAADMKNGFETVIESLHRALYRKKYKPLIGVPGGCPKCRKGTLRRCVEECNIDEPLLFYECDYCEFVCEKIVIDVYEEKEKGDARRDLHKRIQEWEKRQRDKGDDDKA